MINAAVINECSSKKLSFPEKISELSKIDIERYAVDLVKNEVIYYSHNCETYTESTDVQYQGALAMNFDSKRVIEAIRANQQGQIDYQTFLRDIITAGVVGYTVYLDGKQVIYFGRKGESHTEIFHF